MAQEITTALSLCTNLVSATWEDYDEAAGAVFVPFLEVLMTLPLKQFTIRAMYDVGDRVWTLLNSMTGIRRLSVCSSECPMEWGESPRVLQGWAPQLGPTLTYLEIGVSFPHERLLSHTHSRYQYSVVQAYHLPY